MYLVSYLKKLFRKSNTGTIIYLCINVVLITLLIDFLYTLNYTNDYHLVISFFIGIIMYFISLCIALSPVGEWILRKKNGCKKLKRKEYVDYLMPIFDEVHKKAKEKNNEIPEDVELFINGSSDPNAFAIGRKTICITEGLLNISKDEIKAVLAHEMGHLANKDTDSLLVITVGNLIFGILFTIVQIVVTLIALVISCVAGGTKTRHYTLFGYYEKEEAGDGFLAILATIVMWIFNIIWTKLGTILVMKSSRNNEYEADKFSYELGYGYFLCKFLDRCPSEDVKGIFAVLSQSHPDKNLRIARLQELGCEYENNDVIA